MGYYSSFNMRINKVDGIDGNLDAADKGLMDMIKKSFCVSDPVEVLDDWDDHEYFIDEAKWYSCDDDMKALSAEYPDVVFEVHGDGEEEDDFWIHCYFRGHIREGLFAVGVPFDAYECVSDVSPYFAGALEMLKNAGLKDGDPLINAVKERLEKECVGNTGGCNHD